MNPPPAPADRLASLPGLAADRSLRGLGWVFGLALAGLLGVLCMVALALAVAYPNLPEISSLTDYRPKLPLRVFSADGVLNWASSARNGATSCPSRRFRR